MYIMIKDWSIYKTSNVEMQDEWFVQIQKEISQEDMEKLSLWATITNEWVVVENEKYLQNRADSKLEKSITPMQAIALLATCIEVLAEGNDDPRLEYARGKFNEIKNILK